MGKWSVEGKSGEKSGEAKVFIFGSFLRSGESGQMEWGRAPKPVVGSNTSRGSYPVEYCSLWNAAPIVCSLDLI